MVFFVPKNKKTKSLVTIDRLCNFAQT